jgi:hypothetical protein
MVNGTNAKLSIRLHSLLCSAYANRFFSSSSSHSSVNRSIRQSVSRLYIVKRSAHSFGLQSAFINKPIKLSLPLSPSSVGQPSVHPPVRQSYVPQSTDQSILPSSPRLSIDPSVTQSFGPSSITQATLKSKTNNKLNLAEKCINANIMFCFCTQRFKYGY